jgi:hypothetical protein
MSTKQSIQTLGAAVSLLAAIAGAATEVAGLIQEASSAGRTTLTDSEWQSIITAADQAHQALMTALGAGPVSSAPASSPASSSPESAPSSAPAAA